MSTLETPATGSTLRKPKVALVSCSIPPSTWGQAIMLHRLFGDFAADELCVISCDPDSRIPTIASASFRLPGRYYSTRDPRIQRFPWSRSIAIRLLNTRLRIGFDFAREVRRCARRMSEIVRSEKCEAVVGCTGEIHELPAAYWAARRCGVPFYTYAFDYYSCQFKSGYAQSPKYLEHLERYILRRSAGVIVPNEFLRKIYRERYQVEATVVRNPLDAAMSLRLIDEAKSAHAASTRALVAGDDSELHDGEVGDETPGCELRIVYTGSVYEAQFDAFRNLISALARLRRPKLQLHIYTNHSPDYLASGGVRGPFVQHPAVSSAAAGELQRTADILFLPLAFEAPYPELINTSAPSKLGEYLAAGRPILAHAPADSFVAWYFKQHGCGLIVDRPEPELLRDAVARLTTDRRLRLEVVRRARACAAEFHIDVARAALRSALHLNPRSAAA